MLKSDKLIEKNLPFALELINHFYDADSPIYELLLTHSICVAKKAIEVCEIYISQQIDYDLLTKGALLHDIGIVRCNAPGIYCHGSLPYICHGIEGSKILQERELNNLAFFCERHTGSGLTADEIAKSGLPLPHRDMLPLTIEEKAVCYADKFFSKSSTPDIEKPLSKVEQEMSKHGEAVLHRFQLLHDIFS
jgi:uncharacterized protein